MIETLSKMLSKNGKIVLAVWLVLLLIVFPASLASFDVMSTSLSEIDNDSTEGERIISKYFDKPDYDVSNIQFLVVSYNDSKGYEQLQSHPEIKTSDYVGYVINHFEKNNEWSNKLDSIRMNHSGDENSGVYLIHFNYKSNYTDEMIENDTEKLRKEIKIVTNDYMYDIYEHARHFSTNLTGENAIAYDIDDKATTFALISLPIILIIGMAMMGLIFGSAMTSIIPVVNAAATTIATLAAIYYFAPFFKVPIAIGIAITTIAIIISFVYSILIISNYKTELDSMDESDAIISSMTKSSNVMILTSFFVLIVGVLLQFSTSPVIRTIGVFLVIGIITTMIVSMTMPASLITLTKNELFWRRLPDKKYRHMYVRKIYGFFKYINDKINSATTNLCTKHHMVTIILVAVLVVSSIVSIYISNPFDDVENDYSKATSTGESAEGLIALEKNGMGGIFQPYSIVLEYDHPVGYVHREFDLLDRPVYSMEWVSEDMMYSIDKISQTIKSSDEENLTYTSSILCWDSLVDEAKASGLTDPDEIINFVQYNIGEKDWVASNELYYVLDQLSTKYPSEFIVEMCGPYIDYSVNNSLGLIGYEMLSSGDVIINHIKIVAYTKCPSTSLRTTETSKNVSIILGIIASEKYDGIENVHIVGVPIAYHNLYVSLSDINILLVIIIIFATLLVISISGFDPKFIIMRTMLIISGFSISMAACILILNTSFYNQKSTTILLLMPLIYLTISIFFGNMQIRMLKDSKDVADMKSKFVPTALICSVILMTISVIYMFAEIGTISQLGIALSVSLLVDVFIIHFLFSPSLLTLMKYKNEE